MAYRTILVHVGSGEDDQAKLNCAAALADEYQAMVLGLGAEGYAPAVDYGMGYAGVGYEWVSLMREQIAADFQRAESKFHKAMGSRNREWRVVWAEPSFAAVETARAADIIVTSGPSSRGDYRTLDVGQVVTTSGRPVLHCPSNAGHLSTRPVLIAWKDTRESRRALLDALPLLRRATGVVVAEICMDVDAERAAARTADVAAALGRHGIEASSEAIVKSGSTSSTLLSRADRDGVGLIVAGGYGHSRMGEFAFGGVTRTLLTQDKHFVFFSH